MHSQFADTVVIGAGVIGLAVARAFAGKGHDVLVLEEGPAIGQGISSRSSEVIHAGIYYPPDSLKARCCVRGKALLYEFCEARGVPFSRTGKLIVAPEGSDEARLDELEQNARACGVTDLERLDAKGVNELEPQLKVQSALHSPSSGIVDSHALMQALQADIEASGGTVLTHARMTGGVVEDDGIHLQVVSGDETWLRAETVINAAGLTSPDVARSIPDLPDEFIPRHWYVKGHYFSYAGEAAFSRLIYPLPDEVGLGIHATLDQAGKMRFGPDARYVKQADYVFENSLQTDFENAIRRWYPGLDASLLQPGYTGIRPTLSGPGEEKADFMISTQQDHGIPGLVNLFGIESPGLTSCLALADEVISLQLI